MSSPDQVPQAHPAAQPLQAEAANYDHLFNEEEIAADLPQSRDEELAMVQAAATEQTPRSTEFHVGHETFRQMGIAAADRHNRHVAGLPPRTHDLR